MTNQLRTIFSIIVVLMIHIGCEEHVDTLLETQPTSPYNSTDTLPVPTTSSSASEWMGYLIQENPTQDTLEYTFSYKSGNWTYRVYREETAGWDLHHLSRPYDTDNTTREGWWRQPSGTDYRLFGTNWHFLLDVPGAGCGNSSSDIFCGSEVPTVANSQEYYDHNLLRVRVKQRAGRVGIWTGTKTIIAALQNEIFLDMPETAHWIQGFSGGGGAVIGTLEKLGSLTAFDDGVALAAGSTVGKDLYDIVHERNIVLLAYVNDGDPSVPPRYTFDTAEDFHLNRDSASAGDYDYFYFMMKDLDNHSADIRRSDYVINHSNYFDSYVHNDSTRSIRFKSIIPDGTTSLDARVLLRSLADQELPPTAEEPVEEQVLAIGDSVIFDPTMLISNDSILGLSIEAFRGSIGVFFDEKEGTARIKSVHNTSGVTVSLKSSADYTSNAEFEITATLVNSPSLPRKQNLYFGTSNGTPIDFPCGVSSTQAVVFQNSGQFFKADDSCYTNSHHILIEQIVVKRLSDNI